VLQNITCTLPAQTRSLLAKQHIHKLAGAAFTICLNPQHNIQVATPLSTPRQDQAQLSDDTMPTPSTNHEKSNTAHRVQTCNSSRHLAKTTDNQRDTQAANRRLHRLCHMQQQHPATNTTPPPPTCWRATYMPITQAAGAAAAAVLHRTQS
jgi:hypothetical protein